MMSSLGPLADGGRVVIIGGGPGGVGCALALQQLAAQAGRRVQITVLENKQFAGEQHHNLCAGVLSPPLPELLEERLAVPFPHHLRQELITGYVLHTAGAQIVLDDAQHPSVALRRVQFDGYMLETARQRGIAVSQARAVDVEFHADRVVVYSDSAPLEGDVVVGAFGMDEGSAAFFGRTTGYRPPLALSSIVTKYHPGPEGMARFGSRIHAFLPNCIAIEFGAVTPKGTHLTINIAGQHVDADVMRTFLTCPEMQATLPDLHQACQYDPNDLRFFKSRFRRSLARRYYGDRYVMVGDAAGLVRAFKGKGVTSAVLTGIRAAETVMQVGISERAFAGHYAAANRDITGDLNYGRGVRLLVIWTARCGLLDPVVRAAYTNDAVRRALFGAVSGHDPYRLVLSRIFRPRSMAAVVRALVK